MSIHGNLVPQSPPTCGIEPQNYQFAVGPQYAMDFAQYGVRLRIKLQCMRQKHRIDTVSADAEPARGNPGTGPGFALAAQNDRILGSGLRKKCARLPPAAYLDYLVPKNALQSNARQPAFLPKQFPTCSRIQPIHSDLLPIHD
jgi:hypothetical protein